MFLKQTYSNLKNKKKKKSKIMTLGTRPKKKKKTLSHAQNMCDETS